MKVNIFLGTLGLIIGGWILVSGWYVNPSSACEDVKLISKSNIAIGCAFILLSIYTLFFKSISTLFLKSISFLKIILTVVFLVILAVLASPSGITETKFNNLYSEIIKEIEALHEIKDENQQAEEIRRIKANLPTNIGIMTIRQANYGHEPAKNFFYRAEDYSTLIVSNSIRQRPPFPGLLLGSISKRGGCEKKIFQYSKVLDKNNTRFLTLVLDYKIVKELMQNMDG